MSAELGCQYPAPRGIGYGGHMPRDSTATRARILDAALREFAEHGLAGARIDRIAALAEANKRSIYVYFGNKADLFDLVVARSLADIATKVPFLANDLPGYSVRLFDYLCEHPQVGRLTTWAQLERSQAAIAEIEAYRPKVVAIADAQATGEISSPASPVDLLAFTIGIATSWASASPALRSLSAKPATSDTRLQSHRAAIADAVRAIVASSGSTH